MSNLELVRTCSPEALTTEVSKSITPETFEENRKVAMTGGEAAGEARRAVESRTGKSVITKQTALDFTHIIESVGEVENNDS